MTGLEIYKLLPKTNCKKCGYPTCLAFAMALASGKTSIDKCPDITEESRRKFLDASLPPIKTIILKTPLSGKEIRLGGEVVLYRHEKTFYNPCGVGIYLSDGFSSDEIERALSAVSHLDFERSGQIEKSEFVFIENKNLQSTKVFEDIFNKVIASDRIPLVSTPLADVVEKLAASFSDGDAKGKFIPVVSSDQKTAEDFLNKIISICQRYSLPLAIECESLEECFKISESIVKTVFEEFLFLIKSTSVSSALEILIQLRRLAIKKNIREVGYPVITFTTFAAMLSRGDKLPSDDYLFEEGAEAAQYVERYASMIILSSYEPALHLSLLSLRQNIYTDPQKPVSVEPRLYKIGSPTPESPLLVTTNFSLTYYSVAQEIESARVPSYLLVVDTEGMSVLTAWAADKFSPEVISEAMKKSKVSEIVSHKKVIIPGYVAVIGEKLSNLTGFEVVAGPKEASGLSKFLKEFKM